MFAGHFGLAAAVKAKSPEVPLWALMVSTQLLDIAFVPFLMAGVETMEPIGGGGYGEMIIHANYTHSLIGAMLLSLLAGLLARHFWGGKNGAVITAVAFSHWILDLVVHRSDMAILPGNLGDLPLIGLGLWEFPVMSTIVEALLIVIGTSMYFRHVLHIAALKGKVRAMLSGGTMGIVLVLSLASDVIGIG
jgi:membrane-bound metal-dependent hydrolase YbcI (DUF457 family)